MPLTPPPSKTRSTCLPRLLFVPTPALSSLISLLPALSAGGLVAVAREIPHRGGRSCHLTYAAAQADTYPWLIRYLKVFRSTFTYPSRLWSSPQLCCTWASSFAATPNKQRAWPPAMGALG